MAAQSQSIFDQNQKLTIDAHIEFPYYERLDENKNSSFTCYTLLLGEYQFDTTEITSYLHDDKGQLIRFSKQEVNKRMRNNPVEARYYTYNAKGNVVLVEDYLEQISDELMNSLRPNQNSSQQTSNKPTSIKVEEKKFVYDSLGNLVFYYNTDVGYKAVVTYKLDKLSRLIELSTLDTNAKSYDKIKLSRAFVYDNKDRVIQQTNTTYDLNSKNKTAKTSEAIAYYTYDNHNKISTIVNSLNGKSDTTYYVYSYDANNNCTSETMLFGSDTITRLEFVFEDNLMRKEISVYYYNKNSPAPSSKSEIQYEYDFKRRIKSISYFEKAMEGEIDSEIPLEPILSKMEVYTYH